MSGGLYLLLVTTPAIPLQMRHRKNYLLWFFSAERPSWGANWPNRGAELPPGWVMSPFGSVESEKRRKKKKLSASSTTPGRSGRADPAG